MTCAQARSYAAASRDATAFRVTSPGSPSTPRGSRPGTPTTRPSVRRATSGHFHARQPRCAWPAIPRVTCSCPLTRPAAARPGRWSIRRSPRAFHAGSPAPRPRFASPWTVPGTSSPSTDPTGGAGAWQVSPVNSLLQGGGNLSCASPTVCAAIRGLTVYTTTDPTGGTGTRPSCTTPGDELTGLACPSTSLCVLTTEKGEAVGLAGTRATRCRRGQRSPPSPARPGRHRRRAQLPERHFLRRRREVSVGQHDSHHHRPRRRRGDLERPSVAERPVGDVPEHLPVRGVHRPGRRRPPRTPPTRHRPGPPRRCPSSGRSWAPAPRPRCASAPTAQPRWCRRTPPAGQRLVELPGRGTPVRPLHAVPGRGTPGPR